MPISGKNLPANCCLTFSYFIEIKQGLQIPACSPFFSSLHSLLLYTHFLIFVAFWLKPQRKALKLHESGEAKSNTTKKQQLSLKCLGRNPGLSPILRSVFPKPIYPQIIEVNYMSIPKPKSKCPDLYVPELLTFQIKIPI